MTKMSIFIVCVFVSLMINCGEESTAVYWDKALVEIALIQSGRIDFFIPDEGDSGWQNYSDPGADTVILDFTVENLSDKELSLTEMYWILYAGNQWIHSEPHEYVPPIILPANGSMTIPLSVIITEYIAYYVDHADGIDDFTGTGTFKFWINGYDNELYEYIRHNYVYNEMMVSKP
jgi:hypothetical protein